MRSVVVVYAQVLILVSIQGGVVIRLRVCRGEMAR